MTDIIVTITDELKIESTVTSGAKGNTGASIIEAEFVDDDLVFTKDDDTEVILVDGKVDLKGEKGDKGDIGPQGDVSTTQLNNALALKANKAQEAWITPTLVGTATGTVKYRLNEIGLLELKADLANTTFGQTIFTLPTGYRPSSSIIDVVSRSGLTNASNVGKLLIGTTGAIQIHGSSDTYHIDRFYRLD